MAKFKLCPRCELNWIKAEEELCEVCKAQLTNEVDIFQEICPICEVNFVEPGKKYCKECEEHLKQNKKNDDDSSEDRDDNPVSVIETET